MYFRAVHSDFALSTLHKFIIDNPLGIFTTAIKSSKYPLIQSSHIPWVLDVPDEGASSDFKGRLRGHIARANPQTKALIDERTNKKSSESGPEGLNGVLEEEVMVLFNGPVHHYVTPKFYTETKPTTGKVVPTWNYTAVEVYGTLKIYFDTTQPSTAGFLQTQINDLSKQSEEREFGFTGKNGAQSAWTVKEAPESYVKLLTKAIIGIEIEITRIGGKYKMSQELSDGDRQGTINGFESLGTEVGGDMAKIIREREEVQEKAKAAKVAAAA